MPRIIHALPATHRNKQWIVRTDGVPDVTMLGEEPALAYARLVAQRLADRLGKPVTLRVWNVVAHYADETFNPTKNPLEETLKRRRAA